MPLAELTTGIKIYIAVVVFLLGACFGSFVTCAADRYITHESVLRGRSHCPACGRTLTLPDLIPIFSYLFLRGRCRTCGAKIPVRCLVTELIGGGVYLGAFLRFGLTFPALVVLLTLPLLLAVSLIDLDSMEIPNGLVVALITVWAATIPTRRPIPHELLLSGIGAVALGGGMLLLSLLMDKLLGRESLGGGDIKLLFAAGLYTGPWCGILLLILACIFGLVFALLGKKRNKPFPFGPAICAALVVVLFAGEPILSAYLSLFGMSI